MQHELHHNFIHILNQNGESGPTRSVLLLRVLSVKQAHRPPTHPSTPLPLTYHEVITCLRDAEITHITSQVVPLGSPFLLIEPLTLLDRLLPPHRCALLVLHQAHPLELSTLAPLVHQIIIVGVPFKSGASSALTSLASLAMMTHGAHYCTRTISMIVISRSMLTSTI
jgi:hypothetical protein